MEFIVVTTGFVLGLEMVMRCAFAVALESVGFQYNAWRTVLSPKVLHSVRVNKALVLGNAVIGSD